MIGRAIKALVRICTARSTFERLVWAMAILGALIVATAELVLRGMLS